MEKLHCNLHESDQTCYESADTGYYDYRMCKASPSTTRGEAICLKALVEAACVHGNEAWGLFVSSRESYHRGR